MTLQRLLGVELPIIQAPMAGVQGSAVAVAVSNAGGLGSLPCAMLSLDAIRNELAAIKAQTVSVGRVPAPIHSPKVRKINLSPLFCPRNALPLGSDPLCPNGYRSPPVAYPAAQGVGLGFVPADHRPETTRMIVHQGMAKLVYEHVAHQLSW